MISQNKRAIEVDAIIGEKRDINQLTMFEIEPLLMQIEHFLSSAYSIIQEFQNLFDSVIPSGVHVSMESDVYFSISTLLQ